MTRKRPTIQVYEKEDKELSSEIHRPHRFINYWSEKDSFALRILISDPTLNDYNVSTKPVEYVLDKLQSTDPILPDYINKPYFRIHHVYYRLESELVFSLKDHAAKNRWMNSAVIEVDDNAVGNNTSQLSLISVSDNNTTDYISATRELKSINKKFRNNRIPVLLLYPLGIDSSINSVGTWIRTEFMSGILINNIISYRENLTNITSHTNDNTYVRI